MSDISVLKEYYKNHFNVVQDIVNDIANACRHAETLKANVIANRLNDIYYELIEVNNLVIQIIESVQITDIPITEHNEHCWTYQT